MATVPRYLSPMKWVYACLILGAFLWTGGNAQNSGISGDKCRTPDDQDGECIELRPCKPYMKMLRNTSLSPDDKKFLRQSQCGIQNGQPLVCCPSSGVVLRPGGNNREDLANHPNWKLLNSSICGTMYESAIFSGYEANLGQYVMLALLQYETSTGKHFKCGGTLINDRYVLTAAHCVLQTKNAKLISVRLGEHKMDTDPDCEGTQPHAYCNEPVQDINVEEVTVHPQYERQRPVLRHDIALIRLERPATINKDSVVPICLPNGAALTSQYEKTDLVVAGWQMEGNRFYRTVKMWLRLRSITNELCSAIYEKYFTLKEDQICVRGQRVDDTCLNGFVGPLMSVESSFTQGPRNRWVAVGVEAASPTSCVNNDQPMIYTRVAPYMKWILDTLKP